MNHWNQTQLLLLYLALRHFMDLIHESVKFKKKNRNSPSQIYTMFSHHPIDN